MARYSLFVLKVPFPLNPKQTNKQTFKTALFNTRHPVFGMNNQVMITLLYTLSIQHMPSPLAQFITPSFSLQGQTYLFHKSFLS